MKILQINNNFYKKGGAEVVFFDTIELLKQNGHMVVSFSIENYKNENSEYENYFIKNTWRHNRFYSFEAIGKIKELIINEKPELVHIHELIGGISFSILPFIKKMNIPIVLTVHDFRLICPAYVFINGKNEICEKCKGHKYYNCIFNKCSPEGYIRSCILTAESYLRDLFLPYENLIDQFIFVSKFSMNKFLEFNPNVTNKSNQIYNYTGKFKYNNTPGNYFLYFGRLSREKGINTLLNAFKNLPDLQLKIVGEGDLKSEIEKNKTTNIELLGYKSGDELERIIQDSYFVIAPSECYETGSMTTIEAFAKGKPAIGSNLGALGELIDDGNTGFVFQQRNSKNLAEIILKSTQLTKEKYTRLSVNAYKYAKDNFTSEIYYNKLMDIYKKL